MFIFYFICNAALHAFRTVVESEIVTLRRDSDASVAAARESFSISLGSLEEAVRSLDEATDTPAFATIGKKPAVPKRRPVSMTGEIAIQFHRCILFSSLYCTTSTSPSKDS